MTSAVLTTTKGEVLHGGNPKGKLTTLKAEVMHGGNPTGKLTTLKAEVLYSNAVVVAAKRRVVVTLNLG